MDKKLKIIFVGIPDMALVCLNNLLTKKFQIVGVVPPKKTNETYNFFKEYVKNKGLNLIEFDKSPNEEQCIKKIKELNADIGVVCSYNSRFSCEFLKTTRLGYINCHPSLLPLYRGPAPYFHIVNNGEKISGITLHFMDAEFDTGDIVYQEKFDIIPDETMGTIFNKTTYMLSDALIYVLSKLEKTGEIDRIPQPKDKKFVDAPKVDGNFRLRWKTYSVIELDRLIRACNPFYQVYTSFRGASMRIIKAQPIEKKHNLEYGTIYKADKNNLMIACRGGILSIKVLSLGTWGFFTPEEFYKVFSPQTNEVLI